MKLERDLYAQVKKYLDELVRDSYPIWWVKNHGESMVRRGIPDIIACVNGKFAAFELKSDTGKLTPLQNFTLKSIREVGGVAEMVMSLEELEGIISEIKRTV